jgi:uncharacterized membrane protein SirB2
MTFEVFLYSIIFSLLINWTIAIQFSFQTSQNKKLIKILPLVGFTLAFLAGLTLSLL